MRVAVDGIYFGLLQQRGPADLIALAREVGADGLNWPLNADYWADDPAKIAAALADAGLAAVTVGVTQHSSATPGSEDAWRAAFATALSACEVLGVRVIDCWPMRPKDVDKPTAQSVLSSNLAHAAPLAAAAGRVVSLEFEPDTTIERFAEAKAFIAPYCPGVGLTADTYHIIRIGDDLAEAAGTLGTAMGVVHFSGSHRKEPGSEGDRCDYAAFLRAAVAAGYDGDIVLQYATDGAADSLKRAVALTRKVIAECGG